MLKKNTEIIKDKDIRDMFNHVLQEGIGKTIALDSAPTASAPLLTSDEIGVYNDKIYIRSGSKIYRIDPDDTITVS